MQKTHALEAYFHIYQSVKVGRLQHSDSRLMRVVKLAKHASYKVIFCYDLTNKCIHELPEGAQ